jgi:hypothetical protein
MSNPESILASSHGIKASLPHCLCERERREIADMAFGHYVRSANRPPNKKPITSRHEQETVRLKQSGRLSKETYGANNVFNDLHQDHSIKGRKSARRLVQGHQVHVRAQATAPCYRVLGRVNSRRFGALIHEHSNKVSGSAANV